MFKAGQLWKIEYIDAIGLLLLITPHDSNMTHFTALEQINFLHQQSTTFFQRNADMPHLLHLNEQKRISVELISDAQA